MIIIVVPTVMGAVDHWRRNKEAVTQGFLVSLSYSSWEELLGKRNGLFLLINRDVFWLMPKWPKEMRILNALDKGFGRRRMFENDTFSSWEWLYSRVQNKWGGGTFIISWFLESPRSLFWPPPFINFSNFSRGYLEVHKIKYIIDSWCFVRVSGSTIY